MLVAESAAEAPSSLAEPTPSPVEPVVRPDDVATTPVEGRDHDDTAEAARPRVIPSRQGGTRSTDDGSNDRDRATPIPLTGEAARPSVTPLRPGVIRSTDDSVGLVSTMEADDDDWVLVEPDRDIPALPTTSWGGVDFTRLGLDHVELVSYEDWTAYVSIVFDDETFADVYAAQTEIEDARYGLLATYLERQMNADRVATLSNCDVFWLTIKSTRGADGMVAAFAQRLTKDAREVARARGFTRCCVREYDSDGIRPTGRFIFRDKRGYELR